MKSLIQLASIVSEWADREIEISQPKIVFLRGEMGAGKTTFVTLVAKALGVSDASSPSFALHNRYEGVRGTIDHFDLDRLTSGEDLESTGFWDIIAEASQASTDQQRFVMIEWASRLDEFAVGSEGARWTAPFRVWSLKFNGAPLWQIDFQQR